jgi:leader peptidase (prepilin peptidase)/N-methyltransferase
MGFGDVKLALAIGLILGYPMGFFAVILAIWSAALWGVALMLSKRATMKTALPFGSFLSASTIIFIIFEKTIYEKIFFYQYFF